MLQAVSTFGNLFAPAADRPLPVRHLLAGQWALARAAANDGPLRTVLGSCVAIAVWHRAAGVAAVCHAVLPSRRTVATSLQSRASGVSTQLEEAHFLDEALPLMLEAVRAQGLNPRDCETSLVGGASLMATFAPARAGGVPVGTLNGEEAQRLARQCGLRVVTQALGGVQPRQLRLDVRTATLVVQVLPMPRPSLGVGHPRLG